MKYCFLDLETTGFEPEKDSIIEISFLTLDKNKKELDRYDEVVIPHKSELTPFIAHLTGITQSELDHNGLDLETQKETLNKKLKDTVIIGHNIDFDINFLVANGIEVGQNPRIDTHELARIVLPLEESFALEVLSQKYGFAHESAHRAMSDVEACIELFIFLEEKINALPTQYLDIIRPFLENKTNWFAKTLFLAPKNETNLSMDLQFTPQKTEAFARSGYKILEKLQSLRASQKPGETLFIRQGDSMPASDLAVELAQNAEKPVLIISPKLDFFPDITKVPTPEVMLDPERLEKFSENREKLDDQETTFYLKAKYRQSLGYRGLFFFDLFFKERLYWREVCVESEDHPVFQDALEKRMDEKIIACSPDAFLRFRHLELFQDRLLIIDEGEMFAESVLFAPAKTYSLKPYLESAEEKISVATQFFVGNFCKEVIEAKLKHAITPFPQKILFDKNDKYLDFAASLEQIDQSDDMSTMVSFLENTLPDKTVRWVNYFPETGNLNFGTWHPEEWRNIKQDLQQFEKIIFYRHEPSASNAFFRIFLGCAEGEFFTDKSLFSSKKLMIPEGMISASSPDFNTFCADKILELASDMTNVAVNFSSQATLKGLFTDMTTKPLAERFTILGEGASGGEGKVLEKMDTAHGDEPILFFSQRIVHPKIDRINWDKVMIQKFPFNPPQPLLEEIENVMKVSNQNFFEVWTLPHVAANLSRRLSVYSKAQKIICLDPRENAKWGKTVLKSAFPFAEKG